ncbi:hypothetical protein [Rhodococcus sp. IEGM 1406]|uniref:hypothetical protein n=1 Tax=Rhodococcus sp. IEGM 1406 TaxID=3047083 RepID=UPI0024B7BAB3|nr:hypothetical protein [Rhodococcus sp. IEGM 1406]MDI9907995.1 hypothetical protein [Rhodococcus sp. IEGM 1406]
MAKIWVRNILADHTESNRIIFEKMGSQRGRITFEDDLSGLESGYRAFKVEAFVSVHFRSLTRSIEGMQRGSKYHEKFYRNFAYATFPATQEVVENLEVLGRVDTKMMSMWAESFLRNVDTWQRTDFGDCEERRMTKLRNKRRKILLRFDEEDILTPAKVEIEKFLQRYRSALTRSRRSTFDSDSAEFSEWTQDQILEQAMQMATDLRVLEKYFFTELKGDCAVDE